MAGTRRADDRISSARPRPADYGGDARPRREGLPLVTRCLRTLGTVRPIGLGAEHLAAGAVDRDVLRRAAGVGQGHAPDRRPVLILKFHLRDGCAGELRQGGGLRLIGGRRHLRRVAVRRGRQRGRGRAGVSQRHTAAEVLVCPRRIVTQGRPRPVGATQAVVG